MNGSHFYENLSRDLSLALNKKKGFSPTSLKYTKYFYSLYAPLFANSAFYHRIAGQRGKAIAITATCRKLAERYYDVCTKGVDYVEYGENIYKKKVEDKELKYLLKLAKKHNMELKAA